VVFVSQGYSISGLGKQQQQQRTQTEALADWVGVTSLLYSGGVAGNARKECGVLASAAVLFSSSQFCLFSQLLSDFEPWWKCTTTSSGCRKSGSTGAQNLSPVFLVPNESNHFFDFFCNLEQILFLRDFRGQTSKSRSFSKIQNVALLNKKSNFKLTSLKIALMRILKSFLKFKT